MVIPVHEMIEMIDEATTELKKTHEAVKDATAMALELRKDFDDLAECLYARLMNHNPLTGKETPRPKRFGYSPSQEMGVE